MGDHQQHSTSAPETPKEQLAYTCTAVLQQAVDLVSNVLTEDAQMDFPSRVLPGSTIGKHLRHARDYFNLLLEVRLLCFHCRLYMESDDISQCLFRPKPYILNYDVRMRNVPMETSRSSALSALQETVDHLRQLASSDSILLDDPITMDAVTPYPQTMHTSVGREVSKLVVRIYAAV